MQLLSAVVLFTLLGAVFCKKFTEDLFLPKGPECLAELGLTAQFLSENVDDDFITTEGNADMEKLCECIVRKLNAVDENDAIQIDVLKPILAPYINILHKNIIDTQEAAKDAMEACKNVEGNNLGDKTIKILNCFIRYNANKFSNL